MVPYVFDYRNNNEMSTLIFPTFNACTIVKISNTLKRVKFHSVFPHVFNYNNHILLSILNLCKIIPIIMIKNKVNKNLSRIQSFIPFISNSIIITILANKFTNLNVNRNILNHFFKGWIGGVWVAHVFQCMNMNDLSTIKSIRHFFTHRLNQIHITVDKIIISGSVHWVYLYAWVMCYIIKSL